MAGRTWPRLIPVLKAGKKVFIDKPIAGSLADVLRIFALAGEYKAPLFSSSSLRFGPAVTGARKNAKIGTVLGCDSYGPCALEKHHPDLFWYGIHGIETLYTVMGTGCKTVSRIAHQGDRLRRRRVDRRPHRHLPRHSRRQGGLRRDPLRQHRH